MSYIKQIDLLAAIWASKLSYCEIYDNEFTKPDLIVSSLSKVTEADRTIRLDTHEHIPRAAAADQGKGKLGHLAGSIRFEPFILYRSKHGPDGSIEFVETARSHFKNGEFNPDGGTISRILGAYLIQMVESFARKANFRNYSYIDEMKSEALLTLSQNVLKFNEAKSSNAHAYISQCIHTTFIRELKRQKRHGVIRDELLIDAGMLPSFGALDRGR